MPLPLGRTLFDGLGPIPGITDGTAPAQDNADLYSAYIDVTTPVPGRGRGKAKATVDRLGPVKFPATTSYDDFLEMIARESGCRREAIERRSLTWKFDKPLSMKPNPMTNNAGYDVMLEKWEGATRATLIYIAMIKPREVIRAVRALEEGELWILASLTVYPHVCTDALR